MSKTKLNCCVCGKELGLGNRVSSDGVLWRCEDCAIKDNKDKIIADLQCQLALTEKALELACDEFCGSLDAMENLIFPNKKWNEIVDYFKTKAKEMMKSE